VAAAVAGDPGRDADKAATQGGCPGSGAGEAGQGAGGVQQVVRDGGAGQLGRVRGKRARRQVGQRPVGPVGEYLFTWAWPQWCSSAWMVANGESVNTA
jgi:hypothetical protein